MKRLHENSLYILLALCFIFLVAGLLTLLTGQQPEGKVEEMTPCRRKSVFTSKRNNTIDHMLEHHHLKKTPFKKEEMVPAFVGYEENYSIVPKYNLATCNIPKILATVKNALFWLLYDQNNYLSNNVSLNTVNWDVLFDHLDSARFSYGGIQRDLKPGFGMFMVHRDPTARFVSGYVDKCINSNYCFHCEKNITCYAEEQYKRLVLLGNKIPIDTDHGMEDFHFAPQTWFCRLHKTFYEWQKIKYEPDEHLEEMVNGIMSVLEDSCVEPELLKLIRSQLMAGKTYHSTRGSDTRNEYEREVTSNPALIDLLVKMYYYDYVAFGYPVPEK